MYLAVKKVQAVSDYKLILTFENGEKRQFDMKSYLETGIFQELKAVSVFNTVKVSFDSIVWDNEAELDSEILYKNSTAINNDIASEPTDEYELKK